MRLIPHALTQECGQHSPFELLLGYCYTRIALSLAKHLGEKGHAKKHSLIMKLNTLIRMNNYISEILIHLGLVLRELVVRSIWIKL